MTNREHYSEQIIDICAKGARPIIDYDGLTGCSSRDCSGCPNLYKSHGIFWADFLCKAQEHFKNGWKRNMSRRLTGLKFQ